MKTSTENCASWERESNGCRNRRDGCSYAKCLRMVCERSRSEEPPLPNPLPQGGEGTRNVSREVVFRGVRSTWASSGFRTKLFLAGALGGVDEVAHFLGVLLSGCGLDTAGDVDGVGAHLADGVGDILGSQAAGEEDGAAELVGLDGEVPVEGGAGAAEAIGHGSIEQPRAGVVVGKRAKGGGVADAKGLDRHHGKLAAERGGFIAVELEEVEGAFADCPGNSLRGGIDEDTDLDDGRRQFAGDFGGGIQSDEARALFVEHEADGIGACGGGGEAIGDAGDTADFDNGAHGYSSARQSNRSWALGNHYLRAMSGRSWKEINRVAGAVLADEHVRPDGDGRMKPKRPKRRLLFKLNVCAIA